MTTQSHESRSILLVLREGPIYGLDGVRHFAGTVGRRFSGEYWTFGGFSHTELTGRMQVRVVRTRETSKLWTFLTYSWRVIVRAFWLRHIRRRKLIVMSYDPFRNGVIGLLIKWLTGARFVCEVNGVYGSPLNLIDIADVRAREKKRRQMIRLGSFVLRNADAIKLLYPGQLEGFRLRGKSPPQASFFDLVDVTTFKAIKPTDEGFLLFVGYPYWRKGIDILLQAWATIMRDRPGSRLVLIGWGLQEESARNGDEVEGVQFLGAQPPSIVVEYMAKCRALVLPSRSEGMGRVLIEAGACAKPRIVANADGMPAVVTHGVDGLVFARENPEDLAIQIKRVIDDPEFARKLGENAKGRVLNTQDETVYLEELSGLLRRAAPESLPD